MYTKKPEYKIKWRIEFGEVKSKQINAYVRGHAFNRNKQIWNK